MIVVIGAVSVGGLIIASNQSKGPVHPPSQTASMPQPTSSLPTATPIAPSRPSHVEIGPGSQRLPEDGFDWTDGAHTSVRWTQGKVSRKNAHVVASDTEGQWQPEDGYDWVNPSRPDKAVRWAPGSPSTRYPNVVAANLEGQWRPSNGNTWIVNPHRPDDMRVMPVNAWLDRIINPSMTPASPAANPYDQGLADRAALEQWVSSLSGELRRGGDWWAARRSIPNPGSCNGPAATSPEFVAGCEAAKALFLPIDAKRKSNPEYRRGWNVYTGTSAPPPIAPITSPAVPGPPVPLFGQPAQFEPPISDDDQARRLNEQELKRLQGR